jgi:hypothetical protein
MKRYFLIETNGHTISTNSMESPTEFYHEHNHQIVGKFVCIEDALKSLEKKSGKKLTQTAKEHLTYNFS